MNETIKKDILELIEKLITIFKTKEVTDTAEIKELSNHIIHDSSIFQDEDSISLAILIYSLSKVMERLKGNIETQNILKELTIAKQALIKNNIDFYRKVIKNLFIVIRKYDARVKMFINEVINHAQLKKGCVICKHGISLARTASILGVTQWELMQYFGQTRIADSSDSKIGVRERIRLTRSLFP